MDPRRLAQPPYPHHPTFDQNDYVHTAPRNPFLEHNMPVATDNPFLAPQPWQQQQPQPTYPYVAQDMPDAALRRDTSGSPVSSRSGGIPASHGSPSYPVISAASLDRAPKKAQQPMFPDIQLNKDVAGPILTAPPVAVVPEPARPGRCCRLEACLAVGNLLTIHTTGRPALLQAYTARASSLT